MASTSREIFALLPGELSRAILGSTEEQEQEQDLGGAGRCKGGGGKKYGAEQDGVGGPLVAQRACPSSWCLHASAQ